MAQTPINLFQTKENLPPSLQLLEKYMRLSAYGLLAVLIGGGLIVWALYGFLTFRRSQLITQRTAAVDFLSTNAVKEGMILALRQRIKVVAKIMDQQVSLSPLINTTLLIAQPPKLTSFTVGDNNTVSVTIKTTSATDALDTVRVISSLVDARKIKNPVLSSLVLDKDGGFTLSVQYGVIL